MKESIKKNISIYIVIVFLVVFLLHFYIDLTRKGMSFQGYLQECILIPGYYRDSIAVEVPKLKVHALTSSTNFPVNDFTFNLLEDVKKRITIEGTSISERDKRFIEFIDSVRIKFQNCNRQFGMTEKLNIQQIDSLKIIFSYVDGKIVYYPILNLSIISKTNTETIYIVSLDQVKIKGVVGINPNLMTALGGLGSVCRNFVKVYDCLFTQ